MVLLSTLFGYVLVFLGRHGILVCGLEFQIANEIVRNGERVREEAPSHTLHLACTVELL
jgi:hypothetical protein